MQGLCPTSRKKLITKIKKMYGTIIARYRTYEHVLVFITAGVHWCHKNYIYLVCKVEISQPVSYDKKIVKFDARKKTAATVGQCLVKRPPQPRPWENNKEI